jgi:dihydroxy-acid dehydratase
MTLSGRTVGQIAEGARIKRRDVIRETGNPYDTEGGLAILYGNLAPQGAVVKKSAVRPEMLRHRGPARVFDIEEEAVQAVMGGAVKSGDVVVIRYEGPKGGPGMREMLTATGAIVARRLDAEVALIADGRSRARPRRHRLHLAGAMEEGRWPSWRKGTSSRSTSLGGRSTSTCRRRKSTSGWGSGRARR